jgi:hypothetical protein
MGGGALTAMSAADAAEIALVAASITVAVLL